MDISAVPGGAAEQNLNTKMEQFIPYFSHLAAKRHLEIVAMGYEYSN